MFTEKSKGLKELFCKIEEGSKPNRPIDFMRNILPKTPAMVFPIKPKEYSLKKNPVRFAPSTPMVILNKDSSVAVKMYGF